jgi:hypothetical protein
VRWNCDNNAYEDNQRRDCEPSPTSAHTYLLLV